MLPFTYLKLLRLIFVLDAGLHLTWIDKARAWIKRAHALPSVERVGFSDDNGEHLGSASGLCNPPLYTDSPINIVACLIFDSNQIAFLCSSSPTASPLR